MGKPEYQHMKIRVIIRNADGELFTTYCFFLDDPVARQAFAARLPDAYLAGQVVSTFLEDTRRS